MVFIRSMLMLALCQTLAFVETGEAVGFSDLKLEIGTAKPHVMVLEPIALSVSLRNPTHNSIVAHKAISPTDGYLQVFICSAENGCTKVQNVSRLTAYTVFRSASIEPGEKVVVNHVLSVDLEKNFGSPGDYYFKGVLSDLSGKEKIEGFSSTFAIVSPHREIDKQALRFIRSNGGTSHFFGGVGISKIGTAHLVSLLENFKTSEYEDYARVALGQWYYYNEMYVDAQRCFDALIESDQYPFMDGIYYLRLMVSLKHRASLEAKQYYETLKRRYPRSRYIDAADTAIFPYENQGIR